MKSWILDGFERTGRLTSAMPQPPPPSVFPPAAGRPVLLWRPDSDESHVQASVEQAAEFLRLPADAILGAIHSGDLLDGWFVDWQAARSE